MSDTNQHTLAGDVRAHENFHSQHLPTDRTVLVWLPPGYDADTQRRYPVLYLQDGQNIFDRATAFGGEEWRVDETARALVTEGQIEPLIVVAIYNAGEKRLDEYAPTRVEAKGGGGGAEAYGKLLVDEVKPFIDREYRTLGDQANTGIGGSSLGGLVSVYLAVKRPDVFGRLAALSPSVWWDDRMIVKTVDALPAKLPVRVWLCAGTNEGPQVAADARQLRDAFARKGWAPDQDLKYFEAEGAGHDERSWAARMGEVLRYLYPVAK